MDKKRDARTHAIIGAAMQVHKELGCGFLETVYREALAVEMAKGEIPFQAEAELPVEYKGYLLNAKYRADSICFESVSVEVKALQKISQTEEAQVINYLKATGLEIGLLVNFGSTSLQYKRFIKSSGSGNRPV
jgi:GxxExxY protein